MTTGTLTGKYHKADGTPLTGKVYITPSVGVVRDETGNVILSGTTNVELDNTGAFSVALAASDDLTLDPSGVTYKVSLRGLPPVVGVFIPGGQSVDMADVTPVDPAAPTYAVQVSHADVAEAVAVETSRATGVEALKVNASTYTAGQATQDAALASEATTARAAEGGLRNLTDATFASNLSASFAAAFGYATTSANGALAMQKITKVDASGAARAMTLADGTAGQTVVVEKGDSSSNAVTITGKIRAASSSSLTLTYQYETIRFDWTGTYWEPTTGHRTKTSIDSQIVTQRPPTPPVMRPVNWVTTFQSGHGFTASGAGVTATDITSDFRFGSQCVQLNVPAATTGKLRRFAAAPIDITAKHIVVWIKSSNIDNISTISLYLGSASLSSAYRLIGWGASARVTLSGRWTPLIFSFSNKSSDVGTPSKVNITDIELQVAAIAGTACDIEVGGIGLLPEPRAFFPNGVVTFTFDDGFDSVYTDGRRIMDQYGFPGVAYVIADVIGAAGHMTLAQLKELQSKGWEIGAHAFTQANHDARNTGISTDALDLDCRLLKAWMRSNGFYSDAFCYPGGEQNLAVIDVISKYFSTARDTEGNPNFNAPDYLDPMMLSQTGAGAGALQAIADAATYGQWAIIYNHKVGTGGITFSDFQAQVDACHAAGVEVLTVQQVIDRTRGPGNDSAGFITQSAADARYVGATSFPLVTIARKTSDTTVNNSNVKVADAELVLPVVAGGVYLVETFLMYSASTAADASMKWAGPASGGSAMNWSPIAVLGSATSSSSPIGINANLTIGSSGTMGGIGVGTASSLIARPSGILTVGTVGGTLGVTWAQSTADATDAVLYAGSWLKLTRIA